MPDILRIGRKGEVVLPRRVRAAWGLKEGDELLLSLEEEVIVLKRKAHRFAEYLDGLGQPPPGRERV